LSQGEFVLGDGRRVAWPAVHRLEYAVTAAFLGRAEGAASLLGGRGIPGRPALFLPGRTLVVVAYQEFGASPVGPYRQVSVSLPLHVPGGRATCGGPAATRPARAPLLLPLLAQSLGSTERVYRDLHFYVAEIPASEPSAVPYSVEVWGEPGWAADIVPAGPGQAGSPAAGGRRRWEVAVRASAPPPTTGVAGEGSGPGLFLRLQASLGGLPLHERRGYRLVSRRGGEIITDVMRVEAPGRLAFGPWRACLQLGDHPKAAALRAILGDRPPCVQTLVHRPTAKRPGTVTFLGPERGKGEGDTPHG
jgi:hypothetical protein